MGELALVRAYGMANLCMASLGAGDDLQQPGEDALARERAIMVVQRQPELQAPPKTEWNYNNTGFILLSLTVERLSGQSFADYMRDNVFLPLGMSDTRSR